MSSVYAEGVDFALAAYREEGEWQLVEIPLERVDGLDAVAAELRRYPGDFGALALISIGEDFFILVRVAGAQVRLLLSDATAAAEWAFAEAVLDELDLPEPEDDDDPAPAGDLAIVEDLGLSAMDMGALLDDVDAYPDEFLGDIASRLGFAHLYDEIVGVSAS